MARTQRPAPSQPHTSMRTRDADIIWEANPSARGMLGWYFRRGLVALAASAILVGVGVAGVLPLPLAIAAALVPLILLEVVARVIRGHVIYQVTKRRVYMHTGILNKKHDSSPINRIENVNVDTPMIQQMLGIGIVDLDTAGEHRDRDNEEPYMRWWGVRDPQSVASMIEELMYEADQPQYVQARHQPQSTQDELDSEDPLNEWDNRRFAED